MSGITTRSPTFSVLLSRPTSTTATLNDRVRDRFVAVSSLPCQVEARIPGSHGCGRLNPRDLPEMYRAGLNTALPPAPAPDHAVSEPASQGIDRALHGDAPRRLGVGQVRLVGEVPGQQWTGADADQAERGAVRFPLQ